MFTTANYRFLGLVYYTTAAFQAAGSDTRQVGLVEVFSTINLGFNLLKLHQIHTVDNT